MNAICAIGLMSGTSMDGIDVAALSSDGETISDTGPGLFVPYPASFRSKLETALEMAKAMGRREERPGNLAEIEAEITERHAQAVEAFLASAPDGWSKPGLIGFHGQTVLHRPQIGLTVQLGDGALLARRTGIPVVYDMRANDMRLGGQGAPLVPAYHAALARSLPPPLSGRYPVAFVNIGGISNITFVPSQGDPVAFDTGPGNTLIDQWVARHGGVPFDADGAIASEGGVIRPVVSRYLANPFFDRPGPKSLDRNDFTLDAAGGLELADGARTLAAVTAEAILKAVEHLPERPKLWILCGGGRRNPHVVADMKTAAGDAEIVLAEEAGLAGDFTEAEAWAFLAIRSRRGLPLTWPTTTGCREPATGGILAKPG
jgi:anhydro-N-acetylmuramic acid kinase